MHNIRFIQRRFPQHKESIVPILVAFFGSALLVGIGLVWLF